MMNNWKSNLFSMLLAEGIMLVLAAISLIFQATIGPELDVSISEMGAMIYFGMMILNLCLTPLMWGNAFGVVAYAISKKSIWYFGVMLAVFFIFGLYVLYRAATIEVLQGFILLMSEGATTFFGIVFSIAGIAFSLQERRKNI